MTQAITCVGDVVALRLCGRLEGNRGQLVTQVLQPLLGDLARDKVLKRGEASSEAGGGG